MCDHLIHDVDGMMTCVACGEVMCPSLSTQLIPFSERRTQPSKIKRSDRFIRLCKNASGFQHVADDIIDSCKHCKTYKQLLKYLKQHHKSSLGKAPSIWRSLGHKFKPLYPHEYERLRLLFVAEQSASFLVLVPYLLQKIGRSDLLQFVKRPSMFVQRKYKMFLENETHRNATRSLGKRGSSHSRRTAKKRSDTKQTG